MSYKIDSPQGAKMLELRAVASLCQLWQKLGKVGDGQEMLAQVYDTFTEGFDTQDLRTAKTLPDG